MTTKTIELMVRFAFEVPANTDITPICLDLHLDNVTLLDASNTPIIHARGFEFETMEVNEI